MFFLSFNINFLRNANSPSIAQYVPPKISVAGNVGIYVCVLDVLKESHNAVL